MKRSKKGHYFGLMILAAALVGWGRAEAQTQIPAKIVRPNLTMGALKAMDTGGRDARDKAFDNKDKLIVLGSVEVLDSRGNKKRGKEETVREIIREDAKERADRRDVPGPVVEEPELGGSWWKTNFSSKGAKIGITAVGVLLGAALGMMGGPIGALIGGVVGGALAAWMVKLF